MKKRKDGLYKKTITNSEGKRISFYGKTEREINRKIFEYQEKERKGRLFPEAADDWWKTNYDNFAAQTVSVYKPALERAKDYFRGVHISDITSSSVRNYLTSLVKIGLSRKTIGNHKTVLNQILRESVLIGEIPFNPCRDVPIPNCKKSERRNAASPEDEKKVKESADIWLLPFMALYTGARKGELLALQWRDIDLDNRVIFITKSVYHYGVAPYIKEPKTKGSRRVIPIIAPLHAELVKRRGKPTQYLFSVDGGKNPLSKTKYDALMEEYHEKTGTTCTAHQLRHSFATIAYEGGMNVKTIQELLGHSQISTTFDIYTDFRDRALDTARDELSTAFSQPE